MKVMQRVSPREVQGALTGFTDQHRAQRCYLRRVGGRYRYVFDFQVAGEEREAVESGLPDEPAFRLGELVGPGPLAAMVEEGHFDFDLTVEERFFAFGPSLAVISVYAHEYVTGIEVVEELDFASKRTRIECFRYIGREGELLTVPLQYALTLTREVVPGREDVEALRRMWRELPQWARDAYKLTFGELSDLDSGG